MRITSLVLLVALLVAWPLLTLEAQDVPTAARTLVTKAIQAHGGDQPLRRLLTAEWAGRGLAYKKGNEEQGIAFYGEWQAALPNRLRYVYKFRGLGANLPVTTAFDSDKAWRAFSDSRGGEDLLEKRLEEEKEEAHALYLTRLVPLLGGDYKLTPTPLGSREGRYVLGVKVERPGFRDNTLYFDRKLGYLSHQERRIFDTEEGKEVLQVTTYHNFKPMGGATLPQSHTIKRAGKLHLELEINKVDPKQELDDRLFVKPVEKDKP
jgi:hypothetical protein